MKNAVLCFFAVFHVFAGENHQRTIMPLPAIRLQGGLPACGSFATVLALDHKLCQTNHELCKSRLVNVLDILRTSIESYDGNRHVSDIVKYLSEKQLQVEKCRPYESFKAPLWETDKYIRVESSGIERGLEINEFDIPAKDHLVSIFNKNIKGRPEIAWRSYEYRKLKSEIEKAVSFEFTGEQLARAVQAVNETEFISELIFPEKCESIRLPILSFKLVEPGVSKITFFDISTKLRALIDSNKPVFWTYFPNLKKSDQAHVVLIVGYLTNCDQKTKQCAREYLISDSKETERI